MITAPPRGCPAPPAPRAPPARTGGPLARALGPPQPESPAQPEEGRGALLDRAPAGPGDRDRVGGVHERSRVGVRDGEIEIRVLEADSPSRVLVAEFMVLSNFVAARYAADNRIPIIYRVQPDLGGDVSTQRPRLSLYPEHHAGIGLGFYAQLSSPIRRYADLVMQRQLVAALSGSGGQPYGVEELLTVLASAENAEASCRDLERRTVEVESDIQARELRLAEIEERVATLQDELKRLTATQQESEKNSVVGSERLRQVDQLLTGTLERLRVLGEESERIAEERLSLQSRQVSLRAQLEAEEIEKARLESEITSSAEQLSAERRQFDQGAQTLAQAKARFSTLQERTPALASELARLASQGREMSDRLDHLARQRDGWAENQRQLAEEAEATRARDAELETAHAKLKEELQSVSDELQTARARRDELRPQVEEARARYDAAREKRSEVEVALARADSDCDHHAQQCREALQQEPGDLRAELAEEAALTGEALETAAEEVRQLKKKIDNLGPLNMMALEELKEAEERYEFLEGQRQDLLSSIEDTTQAIREIDRLSRQQFMEAFKAINIHFAESFRTLFGGGIGQLRLSDEEDPDSGLDIVAQPPGKRLQNILLLSGGEKALAALSRLIASFRYTPSPFCVLDEVDAPLDDSNIARFTRLVQKMSSSTQFILITHNKTTMEIARAIYGVTMEEPGVSKLISVKLEEPELEPVAVPA